MKGPNTQGRVTAKDVARAAGVSQATVSMALRGSPEIGEKRIQQIRELATQMNYHPRAAAQLLRSKLAGQVGILVGASDAVQAFSRGFTGPLVGGIIDACARKNARYIIEFHSHADDNVAPPYQVVSGLTDGSILVGDVGESVRKRLARDFPNYPWVNIDEPAPCCVLNDSRKGVLDIVRRLFAMGHRYLAYLCGPQRYLTHSEGLAGWREAVDELGLSGVRRRQVTLDPIAPAAQGDPMARMSSLAVEWLRKTLREPNRPTALVCHDAVIARAAIHVAAELGLNVPRDLSVVSWGWHALAQEQYPPMSTVEFDFRGMIDVAIGMLDRLIAHEPVKKSRIYLPPKYIEGQTVAPPPAGAN